MKQQVIKKLYNALDKRPATTLIKLSLALNCFVELIGRRSALSLISYMILKPHFFLINSTIIMCTLLISIPVARRVFAVVMISSFWIICGVTNCVLMSFRASPFTARDIFLVGYGIRIADVYLSKPAIVLIAAALLIFAAGAVLAFNRLPKRDSRQNHRYIYGGAAMLIMMLILLTNITSKDVKAESGGVQAAYDEFGFTYCFTVSLISSGIDKPEDYSEQSVVEVLSELENAPYELPRKANVIFIQLESFFDPSVLIGLQLPENPVPAFSMLKEKYPSGYLHVPVVGGGTANTEFEVLTGMSARHFALGEYPYESVLRERACESIAYNLKELGYSASAIHNHNGTFYSRNTVYSNLGFDRFVSLEYMQDVEYTPTGWAKDSVIIDYIAECIDKTEGPDLVFAVTVQGHGKYPEDFVEPGFDIPELQEFGDLSPGAMEYYLTQLGETDDFISDLIEELNSLDEDVVLVLYGDHLPALPINEEQLESGSQYKTEYVIWSNFMIDAEDMDLFSNDLSPYVLELLDIDEGVITKLHQSDGYSGGADEELIMIEYDMLYGESYMSGGDNMFVPSDLQMGFGDISIQSAYHDGGQLYVSGANFTPFSVIYANGRRVDTEYLGSELLCAQYLLNTGDVVAVCQSGPDKVALSSTDEYIYTE